MFIRMGQTDGLWLVRRHIKKKQKNIRSLLHIIPCPYQVQVINLDQAYSVTQIIWSVSVYEMHFYNWSLSSAATRLNSSALPTLSMCLTIEPVVASLAGGLTDLRLDVSSENKRETVCVFPCSSFKVTKDLIWPTASLSYKSVVFDSCPGE